MHYTFFAAADTTVSINVDPPPRPPPPIAPGSSTISHFKCLVLSWCLSLSLSGLANVLKECHRSSCAAIFISICCIGDDPYTCFTRVASPVLREMCKRPGRAEGARNLRHETTRRPKRFNRAPRDSIGAVLKRHVFPYAAICCGTMNTSKCTYHDLCL